MLKRDAAIRGRPRPRHAHKRLRGDSDDHDDVLLPFNGPFPTVGSVLSAELKYYDTYLARQSLSFTLSFGTEISKFASYDTPFAPERGDGPSHRTGNFARVVSWQLKGSIQVDPISDCSRAPVGRRIMIALVRDKTPHKGQFDSTDVYINPSGTDDGVMQLLRNPYRGDRFEVIRTEFIDIPAATFVISDPLLPDTIVATGLYTGFEYFVPLNIGVLFEGPGSRSITDVVENAFGVIAVCNKHPGFGIENYQEPYLSYTSRFRFYSSNV